MKVLVYTYLISMIILYTQQNLQAECETMENFNKRFSKELEENGKDFAYYFDEQNQNSGTYGVVSRIQWEGHDFVAKRMVFPKSDTEDSIQMTEINILKDIKGKKHLLQYISCIADTRDGEGFIYLLTESLFEDLDEYTTFDELSQSKKISIYIQIFKSLKELHSVGYIHNDVKPPNIMATDESFNFIKLIDFGLTTHVGSITGGGSRFFIPFEKVLHGSITAKPQGDTVATAVTIGFMEFGDYVQEFVGLSLSDTKSQVWQKFHYMLADEVGHRYPKKRPDPNIFVKSWKWICSFFSRDRKYEIRNMKDLLINMTDNDMNNIIDIDDILEILEELRFAHDIPNDDEIKNANSYLPEIDEEKVNINEVYEFLFVSPKSSENESAVHQSKVLEIII